MIATALAATARLLCGPSIRWYCEPGAQVQRVYFANHSSHLDFVMVWSALPPRLRRVTRPVAGRDYWDHGVLRRYLARHVFRAVLIDRGNRGGLNGATAARSVEYMAHAMSDRDSLIVFPEGTRSLDGHVGPFKSGVYHLSRVRPDVELIPVYLENLNRILPKGESIPVPMMSCVTFGPPAPRAGDNKVAFLEEARAALMRLADMR